MTPVDLLPTVPGRVHGIVSLNPPTVQCDGCGRTHTDRTLALAVLQSGIQFHPPGVDDDRRLCRDCAHQAGWEVER